MLNGYNIVIAGGDSRQLEVINALSEAGANLYLAGFDQLSFEQQKIHNLTTNDIDFSLIDCIIVPVNGLQNDGKAEVFFSSKEVYITEEILLKTPKQCLLFSGISTPFIDQLIKATNRKLIKLFEQDELAILNSIPTAEGALMLAIQHTAITIHSARVMVLGFGRVGLTVARLFSAVGARVLVAARDRADLARIIEMGLEPVELNKQGEKTAQIDIFINTIPAPVLTSNTIEKMKKEAFIIDLASKPGGTDFRYAEEKGIKNIQALGLPGKVAPKTAGQLLAKVLIRIIIEERR